MALRSERTCTITTEAPASVVWPLVAAPDRWHRWAPHVRGAWGLGEPEVREGARGAVRLFGAVPVPARVVAVDPGRSWTWQVGPVRLVHTVEPADGGSRVSFGLSGPAPVVQVYGPVVHVLLRNLGRVAERG